MALGWFDGEIKPAGWFHQIAAGGTFDELLIAQSAGSSTITGTLAATDGADSAAFAGLIAHVGSLSATDGADTSAFAGLIAHVGALAATDGQDTFAADGFVTPQAGVITGFLDATDGADIAAFVGSIVIPVGAARRGGGIGHHRATRPRVLIMLDGVRHLVREEDLEEFLASIAEKAIDKAEAAPVVKKKAKRKRKAEAAPVMPRVELKTAPDDMYERIKERVAHINAKIEAIWFAALARKMEADDEEALLCLM